MKPTLREIARRVGLHPVTVSRMLSNTYNGSPATTARVKKLAVKLGYQTSIFARAMRGSTMPFILVSGGHDAYTAAYIREFETAFRAKGLSIMLNSVPDNLPDLIDRVRPMATIILWARIPAKIHNLLMRDDVIAFHSLSTKSSRTKCHHMQIDFRGGFAAMGKYLLDGGHRDFVFLTRTFSDSFPIFRQRRLGFLDAVKREPKASVREVMIDDAYRMPKIIRDCFADGRRPTAIVCEGDLQAWLTIIHLGQLGLKVPQDVSVTGCDGIMLVGACPELTTVQVDHIGIAKLIASWITDDIAPAKAKRKTPKVHTHMHPCYVNKGETAISPPTRRISLQA